ncbi:hypothetical protein, partial [Aeromonas veronii]|uniref:hypothetical protein n=1 Tax=Aeromonas veronii TaxID=654 RepID=UPI003BA30744
TVMDAMKLSVSKEFIISTQPIGCITPLWCNPLQGASCSLCYRFLPLPGLSAHDRRLDGFSGETGAMAMRRID